MVSGCCSATPGYCASLTVLFTSKYFLHTFVFITLLSEVAGHDFTPPNSETVVCPSSASARICAAVDSVTWRTIVCVRFSISRSLLSAFSDQCRLEPVPAERATSGICKAFCVIGFPSVLGARQHSTVNPLVDSANTHATSFCRSRYLAWDLVNGAFQHGHRGISQ